MTDLEDLQAERGLRRTAARVLLSLPVVAVIGCWLLFAFYLGAFRCGDNCSGGDAEHWRYPAQLLLAGSGALMALTALVRGFTRPDRTYRWLLALAAGCALAWFIWVVGLGSF